jgi:seryl-tRNA synthetase
MKLRGYVVIGAVISIAAGFIIGKSLMAGSPTPGSSSDPVVSKSYVDKSLREKVTDLEKKVAELTVQAKALQNTINELQAKVSNKPYSGTTSTSTNNDSDSTTDTEEPPQTTQSSVIGKTAYSSVSSLYLRNAPTTQADIVKKLSKSDAVVIQKVEGSWYYVKLNDGTMGWVASNYIKVK